MDAATVVRLLADDRRRRVFAAVVLGSTTVDEVCAATGLAPRAVLAALDRLAGGHLVESDDEGTWALVPATLREAAKSLADAEPDDAETAAAMGAPADAVRALRGFLKGGRLLSIPAPRAKRMVLLDLLAQEFEPGTRYPEKVVNERLSRWHADTASLRRYLVDEGFMGRDAGEYWRAGGTIDLD